MSFIQPDLAASVADSLITALQLVQPIIAEDDESRSPMDVWVRDAALRNIDNALQSARGTFPNALSFQDPNAVHT
jgi:hypothetical protein